MKLPFNASNKNRKEELYIEAVSGRSPWSGEAAVMSGP